MDFGIKPCELCGEMTRMHNGKQRYCPECALKMKRWRANEFKRAEVRKVSPAAPKGKGYAAPKEQPEWSTKGKSLALVDAEAKKFGLSYGQYMAAIQGGSIERLLLALGFTQKQWKKLLREAKTETLSKK